MVMDLPDPLQPHGSSSATQDAWAADRPEPTNILAFWPDDRAPTQTEIISALGAADAGQVEFLEELSVEGSNWCWCAATQFDALDTPVIVWCEPAQHLPEEEVPGTQAACCRWVIGFETLLSADDPLTDFAALMKHIAEALADAPVVLDVNAARWYPAETLQHIFENNNDVEPPAHVLWMVDIHQRSDAPNAGTWLQTRGLRRCGRPDLEMFEVPAHGVESAAELLDTAADLILESGAPPAGEALAVGPGLSVTLQKRETVTPYLHADTPGLESPDTHEHDACGSAEPPRAVICGRQPVGQYRKVWQWPTDVVERLQADDTVLYRTVRATRRQADLAKATWSDFLTALATVHASRARADHPGDEHPGDEASNERSGPVFLVKAAFATGHGENPDREHLWFEVCQREGDRVNGCLLNEPIGPNGPKRGEQRWIDAESVSDWQVLTPNGRCGPDEAHCLFQVIESGS